MLNSPQTRHSSVKAKPYVQLALSENQLDSLTEREDTILKSFQLETMAAALKTVWNRF